jgi:hypothetical protein
VNSSGGIVDHGRDSSVDSDVEEIVKWDCDLRALKTFLTAALILASCKYNYPKLDVQQKNLLNLIDQLAMHYFRLGLLQVMAFREIKILCNAGGKMETLRKKNWTISFVIEKLALLLVLWSKTEKEKELCENEQAAQSALAKSAKSRTPKATTLKRAFWKFWNTHQLLLKLYLKLEKDRKNVVHCTSSLCYQLTGARAQDHVPWSKWPKYESCCPVCLHPSTIQL